MVYTTILSHYSVLVQTPEAKLHVLLKVATRNPGRPTSSSQFLHHSFLTNSDSSIYLFLVCRNASIATIMLLLSIIKNISLSYLVYFVLSMRKIYFLLDQRVFTIIYINKQNQFCNVRTSFPSYYIIFQL